MDVRRNFEDAIQKPRTDQDKISHVKEVLEHLRERNNVDKEQLVCQEMRGASQNSMTYALEKHFFRLFLALMRQLPNGEERTLCDAIASSVHREARLLSVLNAFSKYGWQINFRILPIETQRTLYDGSWSTNIVRSLYPHVDAFFIPRGQAKAKMHTFIWFNTFESVSSLHSVRIGASNEARNMMQALKKMNFTMRQPSVDLTSREFIDCLKDYIQQIKDQCSVLLICIMSHGGDGVIYDKCNNIIEMNEIIKTTEELPNYLPVVCIRIALLQNIIL